MNTSFGSVRSALLVAASIAVADQLTKYWILAALGGNSHQLLGDFLSLRVTRNTGAAFSLLTGQGQVLGLLSIAIAVFVVVAISRVENQIERVALAMVLGGALGNLVDRILRGAGVFDGAVVDFIDFSFFPAFNLADSSITIGVVLLTWVALFPSQRDSSQDRSRGKDKLDIAGDG